MARNKYPELTYERIVDTSAKLFITKGYEQTSIQDILDALHLSKGGLYHHFTSKEEILEAVMQKRARYISDMLHETIGNTSAPNAKEKLKKILYSIATDSQAHALDPVLSAQIKNPYFVVNGLQTCVKQDAPIIRKLIDAGVADGSLQAAQPEMCAEVFLLLLNFWINPVLYGRDDVQTKQRLDFLQSLVRLLGMDILDDSLKESVLEGYEQMGAFPKRGEAE